MGSCCPWRLSHTSSRSTVVATPGTKATGHHHLVLVEWHGGLTKVRQVASRQHPGVGTAVDQHRAPAGREFVDHNRRVVTPLRTGAQCEPQGPSACDQPGTVRPLRLALIHADQELRCPAAGRHLDEAARRGLAQQQAITNPRTSQGVAHLAQIELLIRAVDQAHAIRRQRDHVPARSREGLSLWQLHRKPRRDSSRRRLAPPSANCFATHSSCRLKSRAVGQRSSGSVARQRATI